MSEIQNNAPERYTPASKSARPIEAMHNSGYHIGKIDSRTLDAMDLFGIKILNRDRDGKHVVELNRDRKFSVSIRTDNGPTTRGEGSIVVDNRTTNLSASRLPNGNLQITSINTDGTTDYVVFEKKDNQNLQFNLNDIYQIRTITDSNIELFPKSDESLFLRAKMLGIKLEYDGSRSNGIIIANKDNRLLGHVQVFRNGNWKNELTQKLRQITE